MSWKNYPRIPIISKEKKLSHRFWHDKLSVSSMNYMKPWEPELANRMAERAYQNCVSNQFLAISYSANTTNISTQRIKAAVFL